MAASRLREGNLPEAGWVVAQVAAGSTRLRWLASRLLSALGKEGDQRIEQRSEKRDWAYAEAWLAGYGIGDLVIDRAHLLNVPLVQSLVALATGLGLELTLVVNPLLWHHRLRTGLSQSGFAEQPWTELEARMPRRAQAAVGARRSKDPVAALGPLDLPWVDWFTFPSALSSWVDAPTAKRLERVRTAAARAAARFFAQPGSSSEDAWLPWVTEMLGGRPVAERIAILRGIQVGAFVNRKNMKVDVAAAIGYLEAEWEQPAESAEALARLRRFRGPIMATLGAVLSIEGVTAEVAVKMRGDDLMSSESGIAVRVDDRLAPLQSAVWPAARAYLHWRERSGLGPHDPLWIGARSDTCSASCR